MSFEYIDMSQSQIDEFLEEPRHAVVGTNRAIGPPQLTPVWYLYENERIYLSMYVKSAKYRNLRRDPHIAICIAGSHPDARAVMIYGTIEVIPQGSDPYDDIHWRLMRRYYETDEETRELMDSLSDDPESAIVVVEHHHKQELDERYGSLERFRRLKAGESCFTLYRSVC